VWLIGEWLQSIGGPELVRARYGIAGALLLVPLQGVISATPFPGEAVAFANSAIYGFWLGIVFSWVGWMMGAFIQYGFAWRIRADLDLGGFKTRGPAWLWRLPIHHPAFLILGRFLPGGFHLVNLSAGAFGIPLWRHAWCAAASILPFAIGISALANSLLGPGPPG
jgi:uncharacterized membrane protein YdjX (TVP38/TMEM64 family)